MKEVLSSHLGVPSFPSVKKGSLLLTEVKSTIAIYASEIGIHSMRFTSLSGNSSVVFMFEPHHEVVGSIPARRIDSLQHGRTLHFSDRCISQTTISIAISTHLINDDFTLKIVLF